MKASTVTITTPTGETRIDLVAAATKARIRTTLLGASTLHVHLPEHLLTARLTEARTATADGRTWTLVGIRREGDTIRLVYEDTIIAALRAEQSRIMYQVALPAADIIGRFCTDAGVTADIDPTLGEIHVEGAGRSLLDTTDSWREISALADRLGGRAFSDGSRLVVAPDSVLLARDAPRVTGSAGAVQGDVTFHLDAGQPYDRAAIDVDDTWTADAGSVVEVYGTGPADGRWLVSEWARDLPHIAPGRVRLTRPATIGA
ncbi:hypothetical protein N8K70_03965 [Microbacterium betulae]|uniref:Uncharacterized protein n=1 Tax=Microbacterium betulae TaxID=2981139 RepID=A0AA97I746_9MICO|nr:hypothetical protein [Microbacterium sp. AB]WOF23847.1 hypothetical protein N8K70_03965 [Microbacterium sp. AB]